MSATTLGCQVGTQTITREQGAEYARLTGDHNPKHFGPDAIIHGGHLLGLVSAAIWQAVGDNVMAREIKSLRMDRSLSYGEPFTILIGSPMPVKDSKFPGLCSLTVKVTKSANGREKIVAEGTIEVIPAE